MKHFVGGSDVADFIHLDVARFPLSIRRLKFKYRNSIASLYTRRLRPNYLDAYSSVVLRVYADTKSLPTSPLIASLPHV